MRLKKYIRCLQRDVPDLLEYLYNEVDDSENQGTKLYVAKAERHLPLGLYNMDQWLLENGRSRRDYHTSNRPKHYPLTQNVARMYLYQHIIKNQERFRFMIL